MVFWIAGGVIGVVALALIVRALSAANPARLARTARWIAFAALAAAGLYLFGRDVFVPAFFAWGGAFLIWSSSLRRSAGTQQGGRGNGRSSDVETEWVAMSLDLDSGVTTGTVHKGRFTGRSLQDLTLQELQAVLAEAMVSDPDAARLIEAYIRRHHPDAAANDTEPQRSRGQGMSRDEALDVLGLVSGAGEAAIRDAHRRLVMQVHPDKGGSDYLAAKINEARDLLLKP